MEIRPKNNLAFSYINKLTAKNPRMDSWFAALGQLESAYEGNEWPLWASLEYFIAHPSINAYRAFTAILREDRQCEFCGICGKLTILADFQPGTHLSECASCADDDDYADWYPERPTEFGGSFLGRFAR